MCVIHTAREFIMTAYIAVDFILGLVLSNFLRGQLGRPVKAWPRFISLTFDRAEPRLLRFDLGWRAS
jgi:hypothetical protein